LRVLLLLVIWFLPLTTTLQAATVQLPETGQSSCYDSTGQVVACAGTGQDGAEKSGAAWPSPRFVDNGDGTVTDKLTGLIWLKNANCTDTVGGVVKGSGYLTWADALTWSNNLASGSCGLTDGTAAGDWRLPNRKELFSLVNTQQASGVSWLHGQGFAGVQGYNYWSASSYANHPASAWGVQMSDGSVFAGNKSDDYYVWPVRGGQ